MARAAGESACPASESFSEDRELRRDDRPQGGNRDQSGDPCDRVVDSGRDPGVGFVGVGENGRGQGRNRARETEGKDEQCREQLGDVVHVHVQAEHQDHFQRRDERANPMDGRGPKSVGENRPSAGGGNITTVEGSIARPALQRRVTGDLLEIEHEQKERDPQTAV